MLRPLKIATLSLIVGGLLTACHPTPEWNGSLHDFLRSQGGILAQVAANAEQHRLQIIYTQIDRDEQGNPVFNTFELRLDASEYFYPASTVKLPTALAALEKLHALAIQGLNSQTPMLTGAALPGQTAATADATAPEGLPSMAQYVRKILLVSDNDAYNRLYEFLGHDALNSGLRRKGYDNSRIVHRLESGLSESQNRDTNPIRFEHNGTVLYAQDAVQGSLEVRAPGPVLLGKAEVIQDQLVQGPKDFAAKNALPLQDQHDILQALLFSDAVDEHRRFQLQPEDRALVLDAMSGTPADSGIEAYASRSDYPDGFVKFLLFGGEARHIPPHIRVFNKSGQAYGFLTDMAYVVDEENGVEFMLGATIYTNANGVFNDDIYEYEDVGFPFMAALGKAIYALELDRKTRPAGPG